MKKLFRGKEKMRRITALALAIVLMFSVLDTASLAVFADDLEEIAEIAAEPAAEDISIDETSEKPAEVDSELLEVAEEEESAPEAVIAEEAELEEDLSEVIESDEESSEEEIAELASEEELSAAEEIQEDLAEEESAEEILSEGVQNAEELSEELPAEETAEELSEELPEEESLSYIETIELKYGGKVRVLSEAFSFTDLLARSEAPNLFKALGQKLMSLLPGKVQRNWQFGFAGQRRGPFTEDRSLELKGRLPEDVSAMTAQVEVELDSEAEDILYAYDITFEQDGEEYEPSSKIEVAISGEKIEEALAAGKEIAVLHIADDGTETEIEDFDVDGDTVTFRADSFSVYVIITHEGEEPVTPRVEYHFIGADYRESYSGGKIVYTADAYTFLNKAGDDQTTQIIKDGEKLEQIANPANKDDAYFFGWYIVDFVKEENGRITYTWPKNPVQLEFEKRITVDGEGDADEEGCTHVYVAPLYENYHFVNFRLGAKGTTIDSSLMTRKLIVLGSDGEADVRIGNLQAPSVDAKHLVFSGWETVMEDEGELVTDTFYATTDLNGEERCSEGHRDGYYVTAYDDLDLYPVFAEARWIYFNTGKAGNGATYVGARYLLTSDEDETGSYYLTNLSTSMRNGYAFQGWFADVTLDSEGDFANPDEVVRITNADGSFVDSAVKYAEDGETVLYKIEGGKLYVYKAMEDVTLYAQWAEIPDTTYSVILWKQKITDSKTAEPADRLYDYEQSVTDIPGRSGKTLADLRSSGALNAYESLDLEGFHYARTDMNMDDVAGDGTTVINVYYDRDLISMEFWKPEYTYKSTTSSSGTQYGLVDGEYVVLTRSGFISYSWSYTDANGVSRSYTGTRYTRSAGSMKLAFTYTGLYGQTLVQNGYTWPADTWWYSSYSQSGGSYSGSGTRTTFLDAFIISDGSASQVFYGIGGSGTAMIYFYKQGLDGEFVLANEVASSSANFNISDKYDGFTAYAYKKDNGSLVTVGTEKDSDGYYAKNISGWTKLHIYFTRNAYDLTLNVNYPNLAGLEFSQGTSEDRTAAFQYEESLSAYGFGGAEYFVPFGPDHYLFSGWYEDETCTVPFDFASTMPAANKVIYAKWTPEVFRVLIDPNGAEIDHINHAPGAYSAYGISEFRADDSGYNRSRATYINATYNEAVSEYTLERNYAPINDTDAAALDPSEVFYYLNTQYQETDGTGLPSDLRNALYITEDEIDAYYEFYASAVQYNIEHMPESFQGLTLLGKAAWRSLYVSEQKYRRLNSGERYEFLGWFKVNEDGSVDAMPYNFADPVKTPMTLRASWRLDGGYTIQYTPEYIMADGTVINGDMDSWIDPPGTGLTYADQAKTEIYRQPTAITANGLETEDYIFRGWRLVSVRTTVDRDGHITSVSYTPLEDDVYYDPGDDFIVQAKMADSNLIIHMQAVYEQKDQSYRRPEVANLTLDANTGYLVDEDGEELTSGQNLPWNGVGTAAMDPEADQILFGDIQSNAAVHLARYATDLPPAGINYFRHPDGYFLLGFDRQANEGDFIAEFAADAVIAVQRTDDKTLYAVWEPMVYITFVNEAAGTVHFGLASSDDSALQVINASGSKYDRKAVEDAADLSVEAGKTLRLAVPYGAEKDITISGKNQLGVGYMLTLTSTIEGDFSEQGRSGDPSPVSAGNGSSFSLTDRLVKDAEGLTVTFTSVKSKRTLVLDDNWSEGNVQEIYMRDDAVSYELPSSTTTRLGYVFQGWSEDRRASVPTYNAASDPQTLTIDNVAALFGDSDTVTLYAVWSSNVERGTVYIYKSVPKPGDQSKDFDFTVAFSGKFKLGSRTTTIAEHAETFELSHGSYLKIISTQDVGKSSGNGSTGSYAFIKVTVEVHDASGRLLQSKELSWTNSAKGGGTFTELDFSVTEANYGSDYYDTSVDIAGSTTDYELSASGSRKVVWNATDAGGTAVFTNSRRTADITVRKVLNGTNTAGTFRFTGSYVLDGRTVSLGTVSVTSGTAGHTFRSIPVGAVLTVTEEMSEDYVTAAAAASGAQNGSSEEGVFSLTVTDEDTITFTNTLRTFPVTFVKVDQDGNPGVEAFFRLASAAGTIGSQLYPNASTGVFWTGDLAVGSYTLTETWVEDDYQGLGAPVSLSVSGEGGGRLVCDNHKDVQISGDAENGFVVTVSNRKIVSITVKTVLNDPLITSRQFDYTARIEADGTVSEVTFAAGTDAPYVLRVPAGAAVTVTQSELDIYDTEMTADADEIVFTNTRKTVEVAVKNIVKGGADFAFPFTVRLANGANPVKGYTLAEGSSTDESGEIRFGLAHGQSKTLTVPVGAVLTVTEAPNDEYTVEAVCEQGAPDADAADNIVKIASVDAPETVTFTNTVVEIPAPTDVDLPTFPYWVLLAGGGAVLLLLLGLRRKEEE